MTRILSREAIAIGLVDLFAELRTLIDRRTLTDADLEMLGYLIGTWATYTHLRDTADPAALRAFDAAIREALEAPATTHCT